MNATANKKPDLHFPTLSIVRSTSVYQPAVPIRAVCVVVDEGEMTTHEETVLGIQITTADRYDGAGVPITNGVVGRVPVPKTLSHEDIERAGYRPTIRRPDIALHDIIIWSGEFGCPVVLSDDHGEPTTGSNFEIIAGPATNSEKWWKELIERTAANISQRLARKAVAQGGAA